ncbi:MAG: phosphotransferase [Pseudomonadota bacterium]|nr:phosphotransferase [Pseudomonadota bacterium]
MDRRKQIIHNWIKSLYPAEEFRLESASSDASFRRYFRLFFNNPDLTYSLIVMDAPPENEEITTFCRLGRRFHKLGINVPQILHTDEEQGFVLMTDLGCQHYLDKLNNSTVERLYGDALGCLVTLQTGTFDDPAFLPQYSDNLLRQEMDLFREWYLKTHLGLEITAEEHETMDEAWQLLIESAMEQPQLWVHRDFHSRNLMVTEFHNPGVIDFQDAVTGPITYDLVSLLKDCYIEWPKERIEDWVLGYHDLALQSGLLEKKDEQQFLRWFHRMGIQRHLKVAGIFARLSHRDGKDQYLNDIPLTLRYLVSALENDPDLQPLFRLVTEKISQ